MEKYLHLFKPNGHLYSVFGGMIEGLAKLEKYKTVLMVRDPWDTLVSKYYSIAYGHTAPDKHGNKYKHFVEERKKFRESVIDEYAAAQSDRVYNTLQRYKSLLVDRYPNVYVTKIVN